MWFQLLFVFLKFCATSCRCGKLGLTSYDLHHISSTIKRSSGDLIYYFADVQQTSTAYLPIFFLKFKTRARELRVKWSYLFLGSFYLCAVVLLFILATCSVTLFIFTFFLYPTSPYLIWTNLLRSKFTHAE